MPVICNAVATFCAWEITFDCSTSKFPVVAGIDAFIICDEKFCPGTGYCTGTTTPEFPPPGTGGSTELPPAQLEFGTAARVSTAGCSKEFPPAWVSKAVG